MFVSHLLAAYLTIDSTDSCHAVSVRGWVEGVHYKSCSAILPALNPTNFKSFYYGASAAIMVICEAAPGCLPIPDQIVHPKRRQSMGEKGSKKDKNKADKQKKEQLKKKKEQQKTKLPAKEIA